MKIKSIAIFCGAHLGNDPIYEEKAKEISQLIASKGINVVFGGGDVGLMKVVADTAIEFGGEVTGITLSSLDSFELTNPRITKTIITKDLFERKQEFFNHSDAFIVLPGGVGSLDELTEVLVSNQLGIINKPVGILNTNNYYDSFFKWYDHSVKSGFVSEANYSQLIVDTNPDKLLNRVLKPRCQKMIHGWKDLMFPNSLFF